MSEGLKAAVEFGRKNGQITIWDTQATVSVAVWCETFEATVPLTEAEAKLVFAADAALDRESRKGLAKFKRGGLIVVEEARCRRLLAAVAA